jgi:ABC-type multidrug transport system fused ATPase/permease subunit
MRLTFKTEDELLNRLENMSEIIRVDYYRRLEQSSVAALSAHLKKDLANQTESKTLAIRAQIEKVNLIVSLFLLVLGVIILTTDLLPYGRVVAWFVTGMWVFYIGATELFFLPILRLIHANHWSGYQIDARTWATLLGNSGFAEHLSLVSTEYRGDVEEDADNIELAIRGYALLKAEQAAIR